MSAARPLCSRMMTAQCLCWTRPLPCWRIQDDSRRPLRWGHTLQQECTTCCDSSAHRDRSKHPQEGRTRLFERGPWWQPRAIARASCAGRVRTAAAVLPKWLAFRVGMCV